MGMSDESLFGATIETSNYFSEGEYIIYMNGDRLELGRIKRVVEDGAFVYYSEGDTASKTPFDRMYKLINGFTIKKTTLGGQS